MIKKRVSKNTKVIELWITEIVRDPALQVRARINDGTVERYKSAYKANINMPPVSVVQEDRHGAPYVLTDGWHRIAALEALGRRKVEVDIARASREEIPWLAARANLTHGLPLKSNELRNVFRAYVRSKQHRRGKSGYKPYREIAMELGGTRSYTTVRNWMQRDFPGIARHMSGEGNADNGGLVELAQDNSEDHARMAIETASTACRAVDDPVGRGRLIALMEEQIGGMRAQAGWVPYDPTKEPF